MGVIDEDSASEQGSLAMDVEPNIPDTSIKRSASKINSTGSELSIGEEEFITSRPLKTQESEQISPSRPPTEPSPPYPPTPALVDSNSPSVAKDVSSSGDSENYRRHKELFGANRTRVTSTTPKNVS